jgi:hypothetical protein
MKLFSRFSKDKKTALISLPRNEIWFDTEVVLQLDDTKKIASNRFWQKPFLA